MEEKIQKRAFGLALLDRPDDAFGIAFNIFRDPQDTGKALQAATEWPRDPEVIALQKEANNDPENAGLLLSKTQAALEVLRRARACQDDEVYVKLMDLYSRILGLIEKATSPSNTTNNVTVTKVIVMPQQLNMQDWSSKAVSQQRGLVLEGERINAKRNGTE